MPLSDAAVPERWAEQAEGWVGPHAQRLRARWGDALQCPAGPRGIAMASVCADWTWNSQNTRKRGALTLEAQGWWKCCLGGRSHIGSAWYLLRQGQGYRCDEQSFYSPAHLTSAIFYWDLEKRAPNGSVFSNCVFIAWQLRGELALHHFLFLM